MGMHLPPAIASLLTLGFVALLFWRDIRSQRNVTGAIWLPVIWLTIIGSRFLSQWMAIFGISMGGTNVEDGSPLDAGFFGLLIVSGLYVLYRRQVKLAEIIQNNRWLTVFLVYCFLSILWSDLPFVAFKRWFKILGHPVMVLILMTEPDPEEAVIRLMKSCAYIWLPVSVLFIKYYPDFGRGFDSWTGAGENHGTALNKNMLGLDLYILGTFFVWYLQKLWGMDRTPERRNELIVLAILGCMIGWLLHIAHSSTSLVSVLIASAIMIFASLRCFNPHYIGAYLLAVVGVGVVLVEGFDIYAVFLHILGKSPTLTDRTTLWHHVLEMQANPILGAGFDSFWLGDRIKPSSWPGWAFIPNEAHNAYLETYVNLGLAGLFLLLGWFVVIYQRARRDLIEGFSWGRFRLAFLLAVLFYGWTEAAFRELDPVYFVIYLIAIDFPRAKSHSTAEPLEMEQNALPMESTPIGASAFVQFLRRDRIRKCTIIPARGMRKSLWRKCLSKWQSAYRWNEIDVACPVLDNALGLVYAIRKIAAGYMSSSFLVLPPLHFGYRLFAKKCAVVFLILAILLFVAPASIKAAVITAASDSVVDVQAAVNSASPGDTVAVPAGSATWTTALVINEDITLQGAGIGQTIITDGGNGEGINLITWQTSTSFPDRLTGFTFQGQSSQANLLYKSEVGFGGTSMNVRVDHVFFNYCAQADINMTGPIGCIDHCQFNLNFDNGVQCWGYNFGGADADALGDGSWSTPMQWGTTNAVYIESCIFNYATYPGPGVNDSSAGARIVFRYNICTNCFFQHHGTETTQMRSGRASEIYMNTFVNTIGLGANGWPEGVPVELRGGSAVIWSNTITGYGALASLEDFRSTDNYPPFGAANGLNSWDTNNPILIATGIHTGASGSGFLQASANWTANQFIPGYEVLDVTQGATNSGSYSLIYSNGANVAYTILGHVGTAMSWNSGDVYAIYQSYRHLDQCGSGSGDPVVLVNNSPINQLTGLPTWPHEAIEPIYQWGNTLNGNANPAIGQTTYNIIQLGRDYFDNTVKPGYTPLVYPHPLVSGTNSVLAPSFTLTVANGSGSGNYASNSVVSVSANTGTNQTFAFWVGQGIANTNQATTTVTMPASNLTVTADYTPYPPTNLKTTPAP